MPANIQRTAVQGGFIELLAFVLVTVLTVALIVVVQEGQRRIPVQYGKRVRAVRGNRLVVVGGQSTHVPLRVNSAGMIPLIFASSFLIFPSTIASYFVNSPVTWIASICDVHQPDFQPAVQCVLAPVLPAGYRVHVLLHGRGVPTAEPG